jgi:hypothetical protein
MNKKKFTIDWSATNKKFKEHEAAKQGGFKDERMFTPKYKEDGTFQAVIRFLPQKDTDIPYVEMYSHGFQNVGGWFVDNCPTTLGRGTKCPVCESNSVIYSVDPEALRQRDSKRKLSYYANILVVNDIQTPSNNGKVFLYRFGSKIYDKIIEKWQPPEGGIIKPVQVFDYYEGANFNLIIKKIKVGKKMMPNYDSANFDSVSCVGTDEEIERIDNARFSLKEIRDPSKFKSYAELKEKLDKVLGQTVSTVEKSNKSPERVAVSETSTKTEETSGTDDIFSGTDESFFENLQNE